LSSRHLLPEEELAAWEGADATDSVSVEERARERKKQRKK
jgi:hypothetical protein